MDKIELLPHERRDLQNMVELLEMRESARSEAILYGWDHSRLDRDIDELKNEIVNLTIVIVKTDQESRGIA